MEQWCGSGMNQSVYKLEKETIKYVRIFNVRCFARNRYALSSSNTLLFDGKILN